MMGPQDMDLKISWYWRDDMDLWFTEYYTKMPAFLLKSINISSA